MRLVKGNRVAAGKKPKPFSPKLSMRPEMSEAGWHPSEFFVPSTDGQGHSARVVAMVTPETKRAIQAFLSSKQIPSWKTEGDLIRWGLAVSLDTIVKDVKDPEVKNAHAAAMLWTALQKQLYDQAYWQGTLLKLGEVVAMYVADNRYDMALRTIRSAEPLIETIEDDYWQNKYRVRLSALTRQVKIRKQRYDADED